MSQPVDRKVTLLKACYDMLKKCDGSGYVFSPMETTVFYDEADCDGFCLMADIALELGIEP
jgi:hypothetical protein